MKTNRYFAHRLVTVIVAVILAGCAATKESQVSTLPITVVRVKGVAKFSNDGTNWHTIKKDSEFKAGVVIRTGPRSVVDLVIGDRYIVRPGAYNDPKAKWVPANDLENGLRILENSVVAIEKITGTKLSSPEKGATKALEIRIELRAGNVVGNTSKCLVASTCDIKFGNRTAHVDEGSSYAITSSGKICSWVGRMMISVPEKEQIIVTALHDYDFDTGMTTEIRPVEVGMPRLVPFYVGAQELPQTAFPIYRDPMTPPTKTH